MALKGQAKIDYQKEYQRKHQKEYRQRQKGLINASGSNQGLIIGSNQSGKTNLKAKLAKAGLNIGKDGRLDLTQSTREPVRPESNTTVPMFNPSIHKAGDKVLVYQGKKLIETVIPELDADGHPVYDV